MSSGVAQAQATFTVNAVGDVDDSNCNVSHCSLREAINAANAAAGIDTIAFDIPGVGPHIIQPGSALPTIADPVVIDGTTEPDFAGTPIVVLDGTNAGVSGVDGLNITAGGTTVRGLVINRFGGYGVYMSTLGGNVIEGNYIGTDITGTAAAGNGTNGVHVSDTGNNTIGGTTAAARNIISGNGQRGVELRSSAGGNVVQGNYVGTDVTGTQDLGNAFTGVYLANATNAVIGGTVGTAGNLISGNNIDGVRIAGGTGNLLQGNFIGTDLTGTLDLGNAGEGVIVLGGATGTIIGGPTAAERNVISGNNQEGVRIIGTGGTSGNKVQGNLIGTQVDGISPLGNNGPGVIMEQSAADNTVGGTSPAEGNTIAYNGGDGVFVDGGTGNAVLSNSIFSNAGLGIDLGTDGVTANDADDLDIGANNLQNFPVLSSANSLNGSTIVAGTLNSTSTTTFTLEFFSNAVCDPSDHGEGENFIGFVTTTTNGSADASFSITIATSTTLGHFITATATDSSNNTSEFSACAEVRLPADLAVSKVASHVLILVGTDLTYSVTVTNNGPGTSTNVVLTDTLPSGVRYVSSTPGCTESAGSVTCTLGDLASTASTTVAIVARVNATTTGTITNTVTVAGAESDPDTASNSATVASTATIPSLSDWGLVALAFFLAGVAVWRGRRLIRQPQP